MGRQSGQVRLFKMLGDLGIALTPTRPYPPHSTVEE